MHARELVELAALVAAHGPVLVRTPGRISDGNIQQYWIASKSRLDRWGWALKRLSNGEGGAGRRSAISAWPALRGVFEEIITGEALTRVWTAVLHAYDRFRGTDQAEPLARSVLIGHLEVRHRVLTLLVKEPGIEAEQAVKLDRLRRRTERWTDLLIGPLIGLEDVIQFAIQPDRARDFADDLRCRSRVQGGRLVWPLLLASLRVSFGQGLGPSSPNGDLNARIASSILPCLQPELCDATGLFRAAWLLRMTNITDDAQGLISELLALEEAALPERSGSRSEGYWDRLGAVGDGWEQ